jgi:hypothetical protein
MSNEDAIFPESENDSIFGGCHVSLFVFNDEKIMVVMEFVLDVFLFIDG